MSYVTERSVATGEGEEAEEAEEAEEDEEDEEDEEEEEEEEGADFPRKAAIAPADEEEPDEWDVDVDESKPKSARWKATSAGMAMVLLRRKRQTPLYPFGLGSSLNTQKDL